MSSTGNKIFLEVQGLRAIAILMVLLYHIWPESVSGGYIGVDVFFVISGFIITRLLYTELLEKNTIAVAAFFSKRALRLLPAALLVLLFIAVLIPFSPKANWESITNQLVASVFYVQNWHMSLQAVDYLGGDVHQSPVKHFWTLSVEEQFYIVWPFILLLCAFIGSRFK